MQRGARGTDLKTHFGQGSSTKSRVTICQKPGSSQVNSTRVLLETETFSTMTWNARRRPRCSSPKAVYAAGTQSDSIFPKRLRLNPPELLRQGLVTVNSTMKGSSASTVSPRATRTPINLWACSFLNSKNHLPSRDGYETYPDPFQSRGSSDP